MDGKNYYIIIIINNPFRDRSCVVMRRKRPERQCRASSETEMHAETTRRARLSPSSSPPLVFDYTAARVIATEQRVEGFGCFKKFFPFNNFLPVRIGRNTQPFVFCFFFFHFFFSPIFPPRSRFNSHTHVYTVHVYIHK